MRCSRAICSTWIWLVSLDGTNLQFGVRPTDNDLCTEAKRPTAIETAHAYTYVWPSTGITECDQMYTTVSSYANCQKLPIEARRMMWDSIKQMTTYAKDASTCTMMTDAMKQAGSSMGC